MHRQGFIEVETPVLTKSTPEGARDYLVPSRVHNGQFYALPQSPQIFKQLLMVSGMDRYYQIARCFRDEDLRRDRQPEFTQLDVEASFIDEEFIYALIEGLFTEFFPVANIPVTTPFPRMTWQESMDRFGIDRPDTRFGMELVDITDAAKTIEFPAFKEAKTVRAIVVPGGASFSRKKLDDLTEEAKKAGAGGLIWIKFDAQRNSSIKKFLDETGFAALKNALAAGENDLALIVAGPVQKVWDSLGTLRLTRRGTSSGSPTSRSWSGTRSRSASLPGITRSLRRGWSSSSCSRAIPVPCWRARMTACSTASSSAADRSASTVPTCNRGCSAPSASATRTRSSASVSSSTPSATAPRRTAASPSVSTAWP